MQSNLTPTKRPRIQSKQSPIDIDSFKHEGTINQRLSKAYKELGIKTEYINKQVKPVLSNDDRWNAIKSEYNTRFGN